MKWIAAFSLFILFVHTSCESDKQNWHTTEDFVTDTSVILNYFDDVKFQSDSLPF